MSPHLPKVCIVFIFFFFSLFGKINLSEEFNFFDSTILMFFDLYNFYIVLHVLSKGEFKHHFKPPNDLYVSHTELSNTGLNCRCLP